MNPEHINVDQAFNPELRAAQADMDAYLETRPYSSNTSGAPEEHKSTGVHDPVTGQFINPDEYFEQQRQNHLEQSTRNDQYEDMGLVQLAKLMGKAELDNDKTKADDVLDVLLEKIEKHVANSGEAYATDESTGEEIDRQAVWLDKLIKVKENYKQNQLTRDSRNKIENAAYNGDSAAINPEHQIVKEYINEVRDSDWEVAKKIERLNSVKKVSSIGFPAPSETGNPRNEVNFENWFEADQEIQQLQALQNELAGEDDKTQQMLENRPEPKTRFGRMLRNAKRAIASRRATKTPRMAAVVARSTFDRGLRRLGEMVRNSESDNSRKKVAALVIGAGALTAAGVWFNSKYGGIVDINPLDGDGISLDLNLEMETHNFDNPEHQAIFEGLDLEEKERVLNILGSDEFKGYVEWSENFKATHPSIEGVRLAEDPSGYYARMHELWQQYMESAKNS